MDELYIRRCFELAERAKGYTAPNPMVGAVLVADGRIIGEGWHREYGKAHAEVNCIDSVSEVDRHLIKGATMYVNLEPCAHYGKTPPCSLRLVQEQVGKVVIANIDPFEKVGGRGIGILKNAGIEVVSGVLEKEGAWLNRRFFSFHTQQRPYIILKWAQTADGYIGPEDGSRLQISSTDSMQLVHKWRSEEAAIMVGYNTALNDDPQLNVRLWQGNQPLRIAIDKQLRLPHTHHLFDNSTETWILNETKQDDAAATKYIQLDFGAAILPQLMSKLYEANKLSLIVEGGALLLKSFIDEGLWDEARVFTSEGSLNRGIAAPTLSNADEVMSTSIGNDALNVYTRRATQYPYTKGMDL